MSSPRILIHDGRVIDPANDVDKMVDVEVVDGKISKIGENLSNGDSSYDLKIDAKGCIVSPGFIDIHAHVYEYATELGVHPDKTCLSRGVTTVVDGGSSGAMTFNGLRKFICEPSNTRVLAFLHIACHGLAGAGCSGPEFGPGGESDHINAIKTDLCVKKVKENADVIVGIKVRLDRNITDEGRTEHELYCRALQAASSAKVPLLVHHTNSGIPLGVSSSGILACPGSMREGDIYTHTYHGNLSSILDRTTDTIYPCVLEARKNGVLFDVGHGQGSFDWDVIEAAAEVGFWPDTISTDLHSGNVDGVVYDLNNVATKFLHCGMTIEKVIAAMTSNPAKAIGRESTLGSLGIGREADVTIVRIDDCDEDSFDSFGEVRRIKKKIVPVGVLRAGRPFEITGHY